jgi:amino acid adenylation domain-containing protein
MNAVVARHEALRTTFRVIDQEPVQIVSPSLNLQVDVVDLRRLMPSERRSRTVEIATEEARRPFDLEKGPLIRCTVLKRGLLDNVILLTMHHIVSDGWSMGILAKELTMLYQSIRIGGTGDLPPLPIQYPDFAVWQRERMSGGVLQGELSYWVKQLADISVLNLPTERPRPPVLSYSGGVYPIVLTPELSARVRSAALRCNATPFMVMLAAFGAVMERYSGQHDLVIGTPVANRTRPELEGLIGFFVNSLVLRIDMSGDPSFLELLSRVRSMALDAFAHQDLPFEKLVEQLQLPRDLSRNPLFQVTFQLVNTPTLSHVTGHLQDRDIEVQRGAAIFDIAVTLLDDLSTFRGIFEYSTDLFDLATIERMARHFQQMLRGALQDPQMPLSKLPLLTSDERLEQITAACGAPHENQMRLPLVHQIIAAQADKTPDAVAVQIDEAVLTYADLRSRVCSLAQHLGNLGVGLETCVGVCMERSLDSVVALLAILEAGAVYVPLDPSYPKVRIRFMLRDADAALILTHSRFAAPGGVLEDCPVRLVVLDREAFIAAPERSRVVSLSDQSLAYVIYTSGSTGQPKGVGIPHKALANHMHWMIATFGFGAGDRILQRTPASFDASVWEYLAPLMVGGRLVLLSSSDQRDPQAIVQTIARCDVTVAQFVPALLRMLLDEPEFFMCSRLRFIFVGGEELPEDLRAQVLGSLDVALVNLYGPTESTIDATFYVCNATAQPFGVPIGRPIANIRTYVLDQNLEPVPVGVPGDLYIGGDGLARGYIGRRGQTAERFIPDPLADESGARMYHTGDRARRLADGNLLFLGRSDHQVKIRGYRIELGEVESAIREVAGVQDCAAITDPEHDSGRLRAFVVPSIATDRDNRAVDTAALAQQHMDNWEQLYARLYSGEALVTDIEFNTVGWSDSYTGAPLSSPEMAEWRDTTVQRIQRLAPSSVLEIGCGAGLLLSKLAPECTRYVGTDFAPSVLEAIKEQMEDRVNTGQLTLLARRADDFRGIESESYNAVVLNSVVQYFPSMDYLVEVLRGAVAATAPAGHIFIGDIRSLPLLAAFHASVVASAAPADASASMLLRRIRYRLANDPELVIDPEFFLSFAAETPRVTGVEIWLKRSNFFNELTRFRYDVILHVGGQPMPSSDRILDWQTERFTPEQLTELILRHRPESLVVTAMPNKRVADDMALLSLLNEAPPEAKLSDLRAAAVQAGQGAFEPSVVWQIAERCGYEARLRFSSSPRSNCFDALLWLPSTTPVHEALPTPASDARTAWHMFGNNPLRVAESRSLIPRLRETLSSSLPEYMVPAAFVLLDELPLLPNGKLDRSGLSQYFESRSMTTGRYVAPRSSLEQAMAEIWAETLNLERVGAQDNFFTDLGGHSLLATQLISRIRQALQVDVPLKQVFATPTVESFAASLLNDASVDQHKLSQIAEMISTVNRMSDADLDRAFAD